MKRYLVVFLLACVTLPVFSDKQIQEADYRRNSLYSILINHTEQPLSPYIRKVFCESELPDKYNDHDLSVKVLGTGVNVTEPQIRTFLDQNNVAAHLVARWFDRNPLTGECDMELIKKRGLYNANEFDWAIAQQSARGKAFLEDAGEDLIGNTFVIVNEISYIDKEKQGQAAGAALRIIGGIAGAFLGGSVGDLAVSAGNLAGQMMETLKGFKVKVNTYLYRLDWNEEVAANFYTLMYAAQPDAEKMQNFKNHMSDFHLTYIGKQSSNGDDVSFLGVNLDTPDQMIQKACVRAIDKNVANLAKNFEPFKVKVRLSATEPIMAPIGMKELVTANSRYEVLETRENENGKISYRQVAILRPVEGKIWDNRFMASEEGAVGADLNGTTFTKVSGGQIFPGMLIREIKN